MADRTSAGLFAMIFKELAKDPTPEHCELAQRIFGHAREYDFSPYQMYADEACFKLGIARMGIHLNYGGEEMTLWPGSPGYEQAGDGGDEE